MAVIRDLAFQGAQMLLVLLLAPLLTGFVRKVKARLLRRQGPPLLQPYRDLIVFEEHSRHGGLASALAEVFCELPAGQAPRIRPTVTSGRPTARSTVSTVGHRPRPRLRLGFRG